MKNLHQDFLDYNRQARKLNYAEKSWEQYVAYRNGKATRKRKSNPRDPMKATTLLRESPVVASGVGIGTHAPATPEKRYTGTLVKGVSPLHKSNFVPVISDSDAVDIAKMRR